MATDKLIMDIVGEIAKEQLPKLADKALARLGKTDEVKANPVTAVVVQIARNWNREHGATQTGVLLGKLEATLGGKGDLIAMADDMTAADLTALTDVLQSAEAKQKRDARMSAVRLGRHLHRFGSILGRALLLAATAA